MKIMVLSDIHGKAPALKQALDIYKKQEFDRLFLLGDVLYHGPRNPIPEGYDPIEVVALLNPLKNRILAIRGNCDSEVDQMLLEFPFMSDYALFQTESARFVLTHGHLDETRLPVCEAGDVRLSGHIHIPVLELEDGVCYFNPGSIALPKGGIAPTYGVIADTRLTIRMLEGGEDILAQEL